MALAILLAAPMRIGNLAALNLVTHLRWLGRDEDQSLLISIPRHEVKNAEALEHEMRGEVAGLVRLYVDKYRPMMNLNGSDWLFPGRFAGPKSTSMLRQQIVRLIRTATGLRLTPHQVRHIIAKLFLDRRPGEYEVVRRILGHKSAETTYQFYSGAETRAAQRHFDKTILNLKNELSADAHARDNHVAQR